MSFESCDRLVLPGIAFDLLKAIEVESKESKRISDDDLLALHSVFGEVAERALEVNSRRRVVSVYSLQNYSRSLIEVKGSDDRVYRLLPDVNYCRCPAFQNYVLRLKTEITCKHVLAAFLARVTGSAIENFVTREQFNLLYDTFIVSDDFELL